MSEVLLSVSHLTVSFRDGKRLLRAVDDLSYEMKRGEMLALVGESGSGKSVSSLALLGLLPQETSVIERGTARMDGIDLLSLDDGALSRLRGNRISMIFQEPMTALNPVLTVGWQIEEVLKCHQHLSSQEARRQAIDLLHQVGIPEPEVRIKDYPHQLSGGMRQRVMIAIALACRPELLIADEPTTALDVTVQAQIMELLQKLRQEAGTSVLLITHNLALVREVADEVAVMYAGNLVEKAPVRELFAHPSHPYTRLLLKTIPSSRKRGTRLTAIAGQVPQPSETLPGCRFAPRCPYADPSCLQGKPSWQQVAPQHTAACPRYQLFDVASDEKKAVPPCDPSETEPLLSIQNLRVEFPVKTSWFSRDKKVVHAVEDVSFKLYSGETLAIVGESGCGKTTIGKAIIRLVKPAAGKVVLKGQVDLNSLSSSEFRPYRKTMQMIFQDPFSSLDPRFMVQELVLEGVPPEKLGSSQEREKMAKHLLEQVGLPSNAVGRYPHQFSGGQRQRIGLARALAVHPEIIICDECTSALDVSVQAQILNLLLELKHSFHLSYIFITHDLSVVSYMTDRILVMYLGRIVEEGTSQEIFENPAHPYTQALIASAPQLDRAGADVRGKVTGEVPSPIHPPTGCPFHTRCPNATEVCARSFPERVQLSSTHFVSCHLKTAHPTVASLKPLC